MQEVGKINEEINLPKSQEFIKNLFMPMFEKYTEIEANHKEEKIKYNKEIHEVYDKYKILVKENIDRIKGYIPKEGTIVEYIERIPNMYYNQQTINVSYLKMLHNRIYRNSNHLVYGTNLPLIMINATPLDANFKEIKKCNTVWPILNFKEIDIAQPIKIEIEKEKKVYTTFIYVMKIDNTELYKIGVSSEPSKRLSVIQTGSPFKVDLVNTYKVSNAYKLEKELHDLFKEKRKKGEWFELSNYNLREIELIIERSWN
jgi:hypothetical protein